MRGEAALARTAIRECESAIRAERCSKTSWAFANTLATVTTIKASPGCGSLFAAVPIAEVLVCSRAPRNDAQLNQAHGWSRK
jgi:hypothetical protein